MGEVDNRASLMSSEVVGNDGDDDESAEVIDVDDAQDAVKPRVAARPYTPTKAEIEAHEVTHLPYRNWCAHCVAGKGFRLLTCMVTRLSGSGSRSGSTTVSWATNPKRAHLQF